jgi:quinol monooxygenase YgiN
MEAIGLLVRLEARPGKEADVEAFLKSAQPLALNEKGTLKWYAIKLGPRTFGIFDTFANEAGRNAHLTGDIAKALGGRAAELFAVPPQVDKIEILASTPLKGLSAKFHQPYQPHTLARLNHMKKEKSHESNSQQLQATKA